MLDTTVLRHAADRAARHYEDLDHLPVAARASYPELLGRLDRPLPDRGVDPVRVIDELIDDTLDGFVGAGGPRFFGWVIGGSTPGAIAADWLMSAWDQNAAIYQCSPAAAVAEEVAGAWLKDVLGLPSDASFGLVTGCQMAHFTALAAARHSLYRDRGVDVERDGLFGAPRVRVITGDHRHESLIRAIRYLGFGAGSVQQVRLDDDGRMNMVALEEALAADPGAPTIVCLMAGDLNTGAADPFHAACDLAHARGAWVHVDGAFGLWMNASPARRSMLDGVERADSWATDGHKWLQLPYDNGFAFVRNAAMHHAALAMTAGYFIPPDGSGRDQVNWNPEWSRRARGVVAYAALRCLGREGVARLVDEACRLTERLVEGLGRLPGCEVMAPARMNQGLVRFVAPDGAHDAFTDRVTDAIREEGTAWFGASTWRGLRVMRISVCNHRTTDADVDRTLDAVERVLARVS
ncbi:aminotransferase class V-fold PLP-dependent enzyme [Gemmatimonadota bacterium DH-20]|uniref:Aminotransferase class V-fold PLP-dependent enzyme n=1 Tax=Gaopeijia maritima TaxID=3119007 RepID=A0ABU9E9R4_9BACT